MGERRGGGGWGRGGGGGDELVRVKKLWVEVALAGMEH